MVDGKSTKIGLLVDVTGDHFTAQLASESDQVASSGMSDINNVRIGQVGSYLSVRQSGLQTLVMVERSYRVADRQGHARHMVRLTPLGEISQEGEFSRGVSLFPTSGAEIHMVSHRDLERVFASHSEVGYKVGRLTPFETIDVYLDASAFFGRHAAILGQSGSGKSWTVTSMVQSALRSMPQAHIILLDMHGEYCDKEVDGVAAKAPFPASKVRSLQAQEVEFPYWLLAYSELCELIIDPSDENASIQMSFLRSILIRLKRDTNEHLELGHITVDSPVYYSMDVFIELIQKSNSETSNFGKTKSTLFGKFDQLLVRLDSLLNDTRYDFLMKPKIRISTESLTGLMKDLVGLGEPNANVTILDLSAVPFDVVPMVAAQIGRLAYEFNFWNPLCREFPIFLICEEAHEYIPREDIPRYREARRSMERIAKNGRKYGVGLCVVSQRPHDVSETVLAQCSSYICLRLSNPDDQEYVRSMVPEAARGTFAALTSLSKGEAIALGEAVPMPVRFKVDLPDPAPNSTDVDYAGKWRNGGEEISVERLVSNWHRQVR
ncbi:MAG: ATPase [Gammaproteobacteria bacterium]|nr:MAG: ATPase [Gammaproteobacteria bacterium]RLA62246.1 MAG: ATPase [Gammaproteobacteria bacterium]